MHDLRFDQLAKVLVEYSTRLKRNENVLIEAFDIPDEMTIALIRAARKAGAIPFTQIQRTRVSRALALDASGHGSAGQKNQVGGAALADIVDGPTRGDEHRSVRRFLFRRLHAGLQQASARHESAQGVNAEDRSRRNQGTGNGSAFQYQGN